MPFLALNGVTVPCRANQVGQKDEEYGLDRFRTFDGTARMTRRGVFRQWQITTSLMTEADANTLLALIRTNNPPLTASGDLVGDDVAVMPIPGTNNPIITATGFKRQMTFELWETGGPLPADTSASVFLFLRKGVSVFSDIAGTTAAGGTDLVGRWTDAAGSGRYVVAPSDAQRPQLDGTSGIRFGGADGGTLTSLWLSSATITAFNLLGAGEIMASVRAVDDPPATSTTSGLWWLGHEGDGGSRYPDTDGHVYDGFGSQSAGGGPHDWGDLATDLTTSFNVIGASSDATSYIGRFNNDTVLIVTAASGDHAVSFSAIAPRIGETNGSGHMNGWMKDLVIFDAVLTTAQRRSWYDYLRGAVADPPLP